MGSDNWGDGDTFYRKSDNRIEEDPQASASGIIKHAPSPDNQI